MRLKIKDVIKRLVIGLLLYKLYKLILQKRDVGLLQLALSKISNIHLHEDYTLDILSEGTGGESAEIIQRKRQKVRSSAPTCEGTPRNLLGQVTVVTDPPDLKITELVNSEVENGSYEYNRCKSRYRVAIIVPLRGRIKNLHHMLSHMHPIWRRQELSYTVFVVNQAGWDTFNKAKLMNAGFKEARLYDDFDCFVFHDVDALLEDDRCLYWCNQNNPRHLCAYADVLGYKDVSYLLACRHPREYFTKTRLFGGVTMFTSEQFIKVNGYSNFHWGWGGEDDDMYKRVQNKGYEIANPYGRHCSYTLLQHPRETENKPLTMRETLLYHSKSRQDKEGLNNLQYKVLFYEFHQLFINITVDVGIPSKRMQEFLDKSGILLFYTRCIVRMPWNLFF